MQHKKCKDKLTNDTTDRLHTHKKKTQFIVSEKMIRLFVFFQWILTGIISADMINLETCTGIILLVVSTLL